MSESESSYVRPTIVNWRKRLSRQTQKVRATDRVIRVHAMVLNGSRRVRDDIHPRTIESFLIDRVSPTHPTMVVVSEPQGTGPTQGVKDAGESERQAGTAWKGPRERTYPTRKGTDFLLVFLGRENYGHPNPWRRLPMLVIEPPSGHELQWQDINWTTATASVRRLQGRIIRAARNAEHAKAKRLQKLLEQPWGV